ncbi:MAG TPA: tetratricopeptide repeat protein [Planctomycetaceae bacterium]|jgi:tetratricopeptide (TPR) repeat protein|nr:tetratricopeptide repeat protein [Planctomycetaceae bacterium]
MRKATFLPLALLLGILPAFARAQEVGDTVIVARDAELKIGDDVLSTIPAGQGLKVLNVDGDWLWVSRGAMGWINKQFVTSASEALEAYTEQIRQSPRDAQAYVARGLVWESKGELDIAILDYSEAMRLNSRVENALYNRGNAWMRKGDYDKAIADFDEMIEGNLRLGDACNSRGTAWYYKRDYNRALADYNEAIQHNPKSANAWCNRGNTRYQRGEYSQAIADCTEAIRLDPRFANAYWTLAGLYANCPDPTYRSLARAIENASKACELASWSDGTRLATLAAVYAQGGNFADAVKWQSRAVQFSEPRQKAAFQARLDLYKARKVN